MSNRQLNLTLYTGRATMPAPSSFIKNFDKNLQNKGADSHTSSPWYEQTVPWQLLSSGFELPLPSGFPQPPGDPALKGRIPEGVKEKRNLLREQPADPEPEPAWYRSNPHLVNLAGTLDRPPIDPQPPEVEPIGDDVHLLNLWIEQVKRQLNFAGRAGNVAPLGLLRSHRGMKTDPVERYFRRRQIKHHRARA